MKQLRDRSSARAPSGTARTLDEASPRSRDRFMRHDQAIREPYVGVTEHGAVVEGLFRIGKANNSTGALQRAAALLLDSLDEVQRNTACFSIDSDGWRRWNNSQNFLMRHGICIEEMRANQREHLNGLLHASLGAGGAELARAAMIRTNLLAELAGTTGEYGEQLFFVSFFGTPSPVEPWGWQLDGHHLNVNCFVLGDQVVMTPFFLGSSPERLEYAPTRLLEAEETAGERLITDLGDARRAAAYLGPDLAADVHVGAFKDNQQLPRVGLSYDDLGPRLQDSLQDVIRCFLVRRTPPGQLDDRLEEVAAHLRETTFAWMGGFGGEEAFYYRVHSPVLLAEFSHIAGTVFDNDEPDRDHIHTMLRTPNGNDYGKELLRLHRLPRG